jgi:hypothetical protein
VWENEWWILKLGQGITRQNEFWFQTLRPSKVTRKPSLVLPNYKLDIPPLLSISFLTFPHTHLFLLIDTFIIILYFLLSREFRGYFILFFHSSPSRLSIFLCLLKA